MLDLIIFFLRNFIHNPSIHFPYQLNPTQGHRGAEAYPSLHWAEDGEKPGQVASPAGFYSEFLELLFLY